MLRQTRGQAGVEMLVVMLLLVPLLLGGFSLAQGYSARHALENGTAVAARQIALQPDAWTAALAGVEATVDGSLLGGAGGAVTCQVRDRWGAAVDPQDLPFASPFSVTCSVPFQAELPFLPTAPRLLASTHYEVMERYP
jgi:Flp pilus assembly protein TadG